MTNTRVAWLVFIFGLIFFGTTVGIITRHTIVSRQQRNFFESLRLSDRYIYERTASNAKEQIMKAASLARTEFDYLRVMRRASHFSSVWDDPQLLLNIVQMAVAIEPQQQRFWVLAVDAAMQAEDFSVARDWALEKLVHPDFKGMVLEAVLRSGGITYSDGTAFGDKLLLLSRLLKDKNPDDFVQAAELTLDGRYAIDAILLLLNRGEHGRA
ncbi:MAG: hypothetical protein D6B26_04170, partial [Spirochaetaceae bacterium]